MKNEEQAGASVREGSGGMFDRIAGRYDFLNRVISLGLDQSWRRKLVRALNLSAESQGQVLDVATGTADVALAIHKSFPQLKLVGLDPSVEMLKVGRDKVAAAELSEAIELVEGDAQSMADFADDQFLGSCISFGIRNVPDRLQGLKEMARVTKPGGKVVILELAEPRKGLLAPFARFHIHYVVPKIGAFLSGDKEYEYLQRSIAAFPPAEDFAEIMREAGLKDVSYKALTFGAVTLYVGTA